MTGRSYGSGTGLSDYATIKYVQPDPNTDAYSQSHTKAHADDSATPESAAARP